MKQIELQNAVEKLNLELLRLGPVDPQTQEKIDALINTLNNPELLKQADEKASVQDMLTDSVSHFESSHPTLSGLMHQVMSLLNSIGV